MSHVPNKKQFSLIKSSNQQLCIFTLSSSATYQHNLLYQLCITKLKNIIMKHRGTLTMNQSWNAMVFTCYQTLYMKLCLQKWSFALVLLFWPPLPAASLCLKKHNRCVSHVVSHLLSGRCTTPDWQQFIYQSAPLAMYCVKCVNVLHIIHVCQIKN